ncbi:unnamed protein product [Mytilus coruscus]|uniref:SWIM-type domain-containing protein n=1 Tax=Mytilus coruscus TaxID=42192 RepID=A0A6J8DZP1_MYTCO|nr:unnamed protein product [Mytilus coruscus]
MVLRKFICVDIRSKFWNEFRKPVAVIDGVKENSSGMETITVRSLINLGIVPDPLIDLTSGWITESKCVSMWTPTMYYDIATFLQNNRDKSLSDRLMKDYKEGMAYSYFTSGWLKEVCYHHIDNNSPYCFLKAECTASQRINDVPHTTWVLVEKASGEIQTAYCTCFAGLGETCNHMAAILFKVDYAGQWGANNKSCTSKPCVWKSPSTKKSIVQPKKLSELKIMKPHYSKGGIKMYSAFEIA